MDSGAATGRWRAARMAPMSAEPSAADAVVFAETLATALTSVGVSLPPPAFERLCQHYALLIEMNRSLNLTRITAPRDAAVKHYADSLAVLTALTQIGVTVGRVLDVGTGAGFPAIPLAVARPSWRVLAIDSIGKKIRAVERTVRQLGLENVTARQLRAEALTPEDGPFDLVCFRAVATLDDCLQTAAPRLAAGGAIVCWKAAHIADDEMQGAHRTALRASLRPPQSFHYELAGLARPRRLQLVWCRSM